MMIQPWQHTNKQAANLAASPELMLGTTSEGMRYTLTDALFERHKWVLGISGSGKSYYLASLICQIFAMDIGFCLIDPHGDLAKLVLSLLAAYNYFSDKRAFQKLLYIDFSRAAKDAAIPFNILKQPYPPHTTASNLLTAIHRAFPTSSTTASLDNVILASALVLIENSLPLTHLSRLILEPEYRNSLLSRVSDPLVSQFFKAKFDNEKVNSQLVDSTLRRSFLLTFSPVLRNTLGQANNRLSFRYMMDRGISCILNLGGLDEETTKFLGCLVTTSLEQAFLSRAGIEPHERKPYHVFIDEFPLFTAQSESSFTHILEQVRKYNGVLYLANQTLDQLSTGMVSSLQNAISINMKAGYKDSNELTNNFYRATAPKQEGFFASLRRLFGVTSDEPQSAFEALTSKDQARAVFENLERQEALISINGRTLRIFTNTIPAISIPKSAIQAIEDEYAARLLTPLSHIEREQTASNLVVVSSALASNVPVAKRRVASSSASDREPVQMITGVLDTDLLAALYHFHYLTLSQLCKLLDRESSSNHVRTKLKKLIEDDLIETTTLARASSGKPPTVYFLTLKGIKRVADTSGVPARLPSGEKKHGYLDHSLACSDMLIASVLLSKIKPSMTLVDLKHERTLKNTPCKLSDGVYLVPDGWVHLRRNHTEDIGIAYEVDRNTEDREKIQAKLQNYVTFASGIYQQTFGLESLTIAFCVTDGAQKRVKQLVTWAEQTLQNKRNAASLFLFGSVTPGTIDPQSLFLDATFFTPYESTPRALVETP